MFTVFAWYKWRNCTQSRLVLGKLYTIAVFLTNGETLTYKMLKLSSQNIDVVCATERLSGAHNRAGPSFTNTISQTVV